jgi:flap endonuclease-1
MGIKNLSKLLKENGIFPNYTNLKDLKNKVLAIDANNYMHIYNYSFKSNMLIGFLKQIIILLKNNITPVYIFDGKTPTEKTEEVRQRIESRKNQIKKLEEDLKNTKNKREILKIKTRMLQLKGIPSTEIDKLKQLLELFNITYIISNEEADDICKILNKHKLIDYSVSQDKDFLLNNKYVISDLNTYNGTCNIWNRDDILKGLDITLESFVDLSIILGCDYCKKTIPKVGWKTGFNLIKEYNNIENIIKNKSDKYDISNFDYIPARNRLNLDFDYILKDYNNKKQFYIDLSEIKKQNIYLFLEKYNLLDDKIRNDINLCIESYKNNYNKSILYLI